MSNFEEKMAKYLKLTDEKIIKFNNYSNDNRPQMMLIDAMNYSLKGGKRIRPMLVYAFCEALGGNIENAVAPACAVEMIHTSAFIHDDLPALDNDDSRRGKESAHKKFGEALAILSGDALSVLPFEVIADAPELTADQKVLIISVLANSVGRDGMIGGQVIDSESRTREDITEEEKNALQLEDARAKIFPQEFVFVNTTATAEGEYDNQTPVATNGMSWGATDNNRIFSDEITITDGNATIGVRSSGQNTWFAFNEIHLTLIAPAAGFDYAKGLEDFLAGIETLDATAAKVRAIELFDLNGRRINTARQGIVIVKKHMSDGSVITEKVIRK